MVTILAQIGDEQFNGSLKKILNLFKCYKGMAVVSVVLRSSSSIH